MEKWTKKIPNLSFSGSTGWHPAEKTLTCRYLAIKCLDNFFRSFYHKNPNEPNPQQKYLVTNSSSSLLEWKNPNQDFEFSKQSLSILHIFVHYPSFSIQSRACCALNETIFVVIMTATVIFLYVFISNNRDDKNFRTVTLHRFAFVVFRYRRFCGTTTEF